MTLERLGMAAYLTPIGGRESLPGRNPTTHRASVIIRGKARPCIVKIPHPQAAGVALVNEGLCFLLAHTLNLMPPRSSAGVIDVPVPSLPPIACHNTNWLTQFATATGWFQSWFPCNDMSNKSAPALISLMARSQRGTRILAFDEWIANTDRHGENLLQCDGGTLIPIDHEDAFGGISAWLFSFPHDGSALLSRYGKTIDQEQLRTIANAALNAHGKFRPALDHVANHLPHWMYELQSCDDQISNTIQFLRHRSEQQWMKNRLGLLI